MYTFDVFDTLLTRTTATPNGIFSIMQDRLLKNTEYAEISEYIRENFFSLRLHAERLARSAAAIQREEEITLPQIYNALKTTGSLTEGHLGMLMGLERLVEYENSVGILENIQKVKKLHLQAEHVVLISDMYLDRDIIQAMLIKADPVFLHIPLYVSREHMQAKWTGNLYKLVRQREQTDYGQWTHYGDNLYVDVEVARKLGIRGEHIPFEPLKPYETKVLETEEADSSIQLTIGTARNARLENKLLGPSAIGASLGGVMLYPYVWWVLQESLRKGIRRLYFIARDGYVLKHIADQIISDFDYELQTHYIYGSRRTWRMASYSEKNSDLCQFVGWSYVKNIKDINGLANVMQIPVNELLVYLPDKFKSETKKITPVVISELIKRLNESDPFKKYLINFHRDKRNMIVRYLQQEIKFHDDEFAFVDLSGGGFTQGCLAEIMSDFYPHKPRTFYLRMDRLNLMENSITYSFLPSYLHSGLILEMFCRAPEGQTTGYVEADGRVVPVFENNGEREALIRHGINEYMEGVVYFTRKYNDLIKIIPHRAYKLDLLLQYFEIITKCPNEETMEFFGGMPNGVTGREDGVVEFAPILSRKEIRELFLARTTEPFERYYSGSSLEYSILRGSTSDRKRIEFYKKNHNSLFGKMYRMPKMISKGIKKDSLADQFPLDLLEERIALYGAGKLGQELFLKMKRYKGSRVVQWLDKDHLKFRKKGLPVTDPLEIGEIEYDQLVIGVLDYKIAKSIQQLLIERGVPEHKILWIDLWPNWD